MNSSHPAASMSGDFLGLLASRGFELSPPVQVREGALPASTQATTVFAFHFSEGVLMVGDRRATAGNQIVSDTVEKVLQLDRTSLLAIAGVPATAFEMARVLQHSFEYYRRSQLRSLSLAAKVRALARLLRENMPLALQGVGLVAPLFAGVEEGGGSKPQIYFYDPLGAQFQAVDFAAAGSGSPTVRSILGYELRFGTRRPTTLEREDAVRFALRLLLTASEFDSATGGVDPEREGFATIKVLRSSGVEDVSGAEQARILKEGGVS